jgi:hypothetical protein
MARIQQSVTNFTANGQVGPWLKLDYYEMPFDLGLEIAYGTNQAGTLLAATLGVDYILDDMTNAASRAVTISQTTTVITVTDFGPVLPTGQLGHGLVAGDAVMLTGTPTGLADGIYSVTTVTSGTVYTLTSGVSQTIASVGAQVVSGRVMQGAAAGGADGVIKVAPVTARTSINVICPIFAVRLHVTAFTTAGLGILVTMQGGASS